MDDNFMERHPGLTGVTVLVGLAATIIVITLVGWSVGWWFAGQNESRTTSVIRHSLGYQSNLSSEVDTFFTNIAQINAQIQVPNVTGSEVSTLKAERYADLNQLCQDAAQVDPGTLDSQQQGFVATNCSNGAVNPSSPYAYGH